MADKLSMSLDQITKENRVRRGRRAPNAAKTNKPAPVGGIKKNTKVAKAGGRGAVPTGPAVTSSESKIEVSNLPTDVNETQIKEYFEKSVGPVKRHNGVVIAYGPNGVSRGTATVIFNKPGSANDAATRLNGLLVDKRPMKIEVIVNAKQVPPPAPVKGLSERIAQPKAQPKPATAAKANADRASTRGGRGRGRGRRGQNAGRGKPKTAEELDAEMVDYFGTDAGNGTAAASTDATANGAAQPAAANGDTGMDDEIL